MLLVEDLMRNNDKCFVSERIIMFSNITELAIIVSVSGINHQKAEMHTRTATAPHVQARCSDRHQHSGAGRGGAGRAWRGASSSALAASDSPDRISDSDM